MAEKSKPGAPEPVTPSMARSALVESIQRKVEGDLQQIAEPLQRMLKAIQPSLAFLQVMNRHMEVARQIAEAQRGYMEMLRPME